MIGNGGCLSKHLIARGEPRAAEDIVMDSMDNDPFSSSGVPSWQNPNDPSLNQGTYSSPEQSATGLCDSFTCGLFAVGAHSGAMFPLFIGGVVTIKIGQKLHELWSNSADNRATANIFEKLIPEAEKVNRHSAEDVALQVTNEKMLSTVISAASFAHELDMNPAEPEQAFKKSFGRAPVEADRMMIGESSAALRSGRHFETCLASQLFAQFEKANNSAPSKREQKQLIQLSNTLAEDYVREAKDEMRRATGQSHYGLKVEDLYAVERKLKTGMNLKTNNIKEPLRRDKVDPQSGEHIKREDQEHSMSSALEAKMNENMQEIFDLRDTLRAEQNTGTNTKQRRSI